MSLEPEEMKILLDMNGELKGLHSKLDGLYNQRYEDRRAQEKICEDHRTWTARIDRDMKSLLTLRQRLQGAWTAVKWSAKVGTPVLGAVWAGIKWYTTHKSQGGQP